VKEKPGETIFADALAYGTAAVYHSKSAKYIKPRWGDVRSQRSKHSKLPSG